MQWQTPLCAEPNQTIKGPMDLLVGLQLLTLMHPRKTTVMGVAHNTMQPTREAQGSVCCTHQELRDGRPN